MGQTYQNPIREDGTDGPCNAHAYLDDSPLTVEASQGREHTQGILTVVNETKSDVEPKEGKRNRRHDVKEDDNEDRENPRCAALG